MIINRLKQSLQEDEFLIVVRALRQNSIIWQALEETDLFEKIKSQSNLGIRRWSPANLALTVLGLSEKNFMLANSDLHLDDEYKFKAASTLEKLLTPGFAIPPETELAGSGLAALAIRERWMLLEHVEENFFQFIPENNQIWKTIISILFGLIPNQKELQSYLLTSNKESDHNLALHGVMSQPLPIEDQSQFLFSIIADLPAFQRPQIMKSIYQNYPMLAKHIAAQLLDYLGRNETENQEPFQELVHFVERTELLKITGRYNEVLPTLDKFNQTTAKMQADISAQLAQAAARGKDQKTALEAIGKINELEKTIQEHNTANITLAQINTGTLEQTLAFNNAQIGEGQGISNLAYILANSKIALQKSEIKKAQHFAHVVYESTLKLLSNTELSKITLPASITPDFLQTLMETLMSLKLSVEAVQIGQHAQQYFPNNPDIVHLLARSYELIGDTQKAIEFEQIAHVLSPEDKDIHQKLIDLLTLDDQWVEARKEAEIYMHGLEHPIAKDFTILANCYVKTGQFSDAIKICEKGLSIFPDHWQFHQLLGRIYKHNQNNAAAQNHFSNAIIIEPQAVDPWLEIAEMHISTNEPEKAIEKLLSASDVIPNNPIINLRLGLLYLHSHEQIKALTSFNQAARFASPDTDIEIKRQIDLHLGKTLFESGYTDEAIVVLEKSSVSHPADAEIAHVYAKALIKADRFGEAFPPLSLTIQSDQPSSEALLDYSYLLLELSKSPELALDHINHVLDINPNDERAIILQARATAAADDHTTAIKLFQAAFQTNLSRQPEYFTMLVTGIADSAFKTSQPEVAITFLQEALRQMPQNLILKQKLCQAYIHSNLKQDALNLLLEIKDKHMDKLADHLWVTDQAIALKELELAIQTLDQASKIAPQNAEVIVRLGYVQLENGQQELARKTFGQLFSADNVDITDMKMAAHALISLGDISSSIPYLEKALELCDYQSGDLLGELTKLHLQSGHYIAALNTIQKHIQIEANSPQIWVLKSQILNKVGRPKAAIESITQALKLDPKSAELHCKAAVLLRENQNLQASLAHIQKAVELDPENMLFKLKAADIYRACIRDNEAFEIISNINVEDESLDWQLTQAEILLETQAIENLIAAKNIVEKAIETNNTDPKALALQSRIFTKTGKVNQANESFENALLHFSSDALSNLEYQSKCSILLSIGEAALDLNYWDIAIYMGREAEKITPVEPRPHLFLVKTYTIRAEYQHTCRATQIINHAPGDVALSSHAQDSFKQSLQTLYNITPDPNETLLIKKWEQRGKYAFFNQVPDENCAMFSADDFAATIAAWRRTGEKIKPNIALDDWLDHDLIKFQLSLTFAKSQIHNAENIAGEIVQSKSPSPIYLANHAFLAKRSGNPGDALQSIKRALSIWPDEPRWHAFAAELETSRSNYSQAIDHLEHACGLERDYPEHHYQLGLVYLFDNLPGNAIRAFQSASSLNPLEPRYWISLAKALKEASEFDQSMASIEKAIKLSPNKAMPILLAAEIANANQESKKADKYLQEALRMKPTDPEDINIITGILIAKNKPKEALQVLDNLIDHAVSPIPLLLQKAALLGETNGLQAKIKLLVQLVLESPKDPLVLSQLAGAYIENNQPAEAIRAAQYALKNGQDIFNTEEKAKLHYQLGVLFQQSGQLDQSLHHLSEAVKLAPMFLDAYLDLAETFRQRREYDRAFSYLETAIEIAPQDPRPYLYAGMLLKDGKDYSGSESMLRKASALAPKDVFIQRQLAAVIALAIIHQPENA